jgi:glycosyltransferase involved in cell wall biosynthesis
MLTSTSGSQLKFDAVIILAWSDWDQEMRSNRYHYASRFAREVPVFFVQPDQSTETYILRESDVANVRIVQVNSKFDLTQLESINQLIQDQNISAPLFWVYNCDFWKLLFKYRCSPIIYHATEDYFSTAFNHGVRGLEIAIKLRFVLRCTNLLVSVSNGLEANYQTKGNYTNQSIMVGNGCDYSDWQLNANELVWLNKKPNTKIAFYQGGISRKLDFELLNHLATNLNDWLFLFAGKIFECNDEFSKLLEHKNVSYLGYLPVSRVRDYALIADVGLNPFICNDWTIRRGFPLKAFEYLSVGLPVVSVPIDSLLKYQDVFSFAQDKNGFTFLIRSISESRTDPNAIERRAQCASSADFEIKFQDVLSHIGKLQNSQHSSNLSTKSIMIFYVYIMILDNMLKFARRIKQYLPSWMG